MTSRTQRTIGLGAALAAVRARHPTAYVEGSTGFGRSYWVLDESGIVRMVATSRPIPRNASNPDTCRMEITFLAPHEQYP